MIDSIQAIDAEIASAKSDIDRMKSRIMVNEAKISGLQEKKELLMINPASATLIKWFVFERGQYNKYPLSLKCRERNSPESDDCPVIEERVLTDPRDALNWIGKMSRKHSLTIPVDIYRTLQKDVFWKFANMDDNKPSEKEIIGIVSRREEKSWFLVNKN